MSDCIFCKIIKGEIPAKKVLEDKDFIVFYDINPKAPLHVLLVPKKHIISLQDTKEEDRELLGSLMVLVNRVAQTLGIARDGYKIVINNGKNSGQLVFHLHLHLLGGWKEQSHWEV